MDTLKAVFNQVIGVEPVLTVDMAEPVHEALDP
jgi:hypothetical protein